MYTSLRYRLTLVGLAALSLLLFAGVRVGVVATLPSYNEGLRASETTLAAMRAIRAARGTPNPSETVTTDPLQEAMLGPYTTPITTDPGSLTSKITATNPNFAAVIVELLREAGVGPGDVVAVSYTGSFPVLDLATIIATETLGAEPIIVSSVGASNWGATDPEFTILDFESIAARAGLIRHRSVAAWVGGVFKRHPMPENGRQMANAAIARNGIPLLGATSLRSGVEERLRVYTEQAGGRPLKAFVNVGGGQVSTGGRRFRQQVTPGLTLPNAPLEEVGQGLLVRMHSAGVPIIHLADVAQLAHRHELPIAPQRTPPVPDGGPYHDWPRIRIGAALAVVVLVAALVGARLLLLTPKVDQGFDPYFGTSGASIRRLLMGTWRSRGAGGSLIEAGLKPREPVRPKQGQPASHFRRRGRDRGGLTRPADVPYGQRHDGKLT
jgi:poly-gamma-glutamate system protein